MIVEGGTARAFTRRGYNWSPRYLKIVGAADYQALERELGNLNSERLMFYAFDLLHLNGRDPREQQLAKRKTALAKLFEDSEPPLIYTEHLDAFWRE